MARSSRAVGSAINPDWPIEGSPTTQSVRDNFVAAKAEIETLQATAGVGPEGPKGDTGNTGPAGTIAVGTVTTGVAGTNASVTNTGSPQAAVLNFTIPRGEAGAAVGEGITEQQAIDAVRQARPVFNDTGATSLSTIGLTIPAAVLGAGWTLVSGSGATAVYHHEPGNTANLAFPIDGLTNGLRFVIGWDSVTGAADVVGRRFSAYLATSATATSGTGTAGHYYNRDLFTSAIPGTGVYTHLVIVPETDWDGNIRIQTVTRVNSGHSPSMYLKDTNNPVISTSLNIGMGPYNGGAWWVSSPPACGYGGYCMENAYGGHFGCGFGYYALRNTITRSYGGDATPGAHNAAFGHYTLQNCTVGRNNCGFGYYALAAVAPANFNTAMGFYALANNKEGSDNTALGNNAGRYVGAGTTNLVRADQSVLIGSGARPAADAETNQIVIGYNAIVAGSNTITLGNDAITELHCNVQAISVLSDPRVKEDIHPADLDICLSALKSLPVHRWTWANIAGVHRDRHVTGFLSEELEQVFPKAVTTGPGCLVRRDDDGNPVMTTITEEVEVWNQDNPDEPLLVEREREIEEIVHLDDLRRVNLTELVPTLWGAVQRLAARVEELEQQLRTPQTPPQPAAAAPAPRTIASQRPRR